MPPLVSVCIPTYRRLEYLKEAVASAQAQTYPAIEIIIGDDGGTDAIREWATATALADPRVRYQRNSRRLGLAGNWNAVARSARGEYLVIIGDDDRLLPTFAERLMAARTSSAAVLFANHYLIDVAGARLEAESIEFNRHYGRDRLPPGEVADAAACVWQNSVPMSASLIRTSDVQRLGFKEDINTPEIELFARMANEGARFVFVPEYLAEYRTHVGSSTAEGLWVERLVGHLEPIAVAPHVEPYKRRLMEPLLVAAVGRCLDRGDRTTARALLASRYYPRGWKQLAAIAVQRTSARLPEPLAGWTYRLATRSVRRVRAIVARLRSG